MEALTWLQENWDNIVFAITAVVTAASAITAMTPTQTDDNVIKKIKTILNTLALNIKHAKTK